MRGEASRVTDWRGANVGRQLNLPPSYLLIHRVSTAGIGVLCQLEASGEFRAEVLRWMPGYGPPGTSDPAEPEPADWLARPTRNRQTRAQPGQSDSGLTTRQADGRAGRVARRPRRGGYPARHSGRMTGRRTA